MSTKPLRVVSYYAPEFQRDLCGNALMRCPVCNTGVLSAMPSETTSYPVQCTNHAPHPRMAVLIAGISIEIEVESVEP